MDKNTETAQAKEANRYDIMKAGLAELQAQRKASVKALREKIAAAKKEHKTFLAEVYAPKRAEIMKAFAEAKKVREPKAEKPAKKAEKVEAKVEA